MTPNGNGNFGCRNCEVGTGLWTATCTCEEFESGYDRREYSEYPCEYTELALATRRDTCHAAWHGNACLPTHSASTWNVPACGR